MRYIFFSLRNFDKDVGESVRMYGMLNSLAVEGKEVIFISNAKKYEAFHPSVQHIYIDYDFKDKRELQGLLSIFPADFIYKRYSTLFESLQNAIQKIQIGKEPIYFFDYLDNSIGYILKKKGIISKYINDVHGIATIEFLNHIKNSRAIKSRLLNRIKYQLSNKLDRKVFELADGFIYGSDKMKQYYEKMYNLNGKESHIIPYVLSEDAVKREADLQLELKLRRDLNIAPEHFIILFVGTYKPTAGVEDLIKAFDLLCRDFNDCKLLLIGGGPYKDMCLELANELPSKKNIDFIESIPYSHLPTYQSISNVIVCPDKNNLFSQYVVHVKYFDALISGKLVINGAFESVREINKNEALSLTFEPSNVKDLYRKLKLCKEEYKFLSEKYKDTKSYTANNLTYRSYIKKFIN